MDKIYIIGCGRSGTGYIAKLLSAAGLDIGHEYMGRDGTADWHAAAIPHDEDCVVLQQVRSPLATISSLQAISAASWEYIAGFISLPDDPMERCMVYWLEWNKLAAQQSVFTYQVEEVSRFWAKLRNLAGLGPEVRMPNIPNDINTRHLSYSPLDWWALEACNYALVEKIREQARGYGYKMLYSD